MSFQNLTVFVLRSLSCSILRRKDWAELPVTLAATDLRINWTPSQPAVLSVVLVFCLVLPSPHASAQQSDPCPPSISIDGAPFPSSTCGEAQPSIGSDAEYGPTQIVGGLCPNVPESFPAVTHVTSQSAFQVAYNTINPGEAIIIDDGTYNWSSITLNRNGTSSNPIYILANNLHSAVFVNASMRFFMTGDYNVVSGLELNSHNTTPFEVTGYSNRVACINTVGDIVGHFLYLPSANNADFLEVDNNVITNASFQGLRLHRCNPTVPSCTHTAMGIHIHHNTFQDQEDDPVDSNDHEAIMMGLGYYPADGESIYNPNGPTGQNMDMLVENNLFDGWNGEQELISMKSSHNIFRNNCIKNSPNSVINIRLGDDNLITGNWTENGREGIRISGERNYVVFNYHSKNTQGNAGFRLHPSNRYTSGTTNLKQYGDVVDNVLRYNVFNKHTNMIQVMLRYNTFLQNPADNVMSDNVFYSDSMAGNSNSGSYINLDGKFTESAYRAANTWGVNTIVSSDLAESGNCGDATLFNGPGTSISGSPDLLGSPFVISAPSWWR